MAYWVTAQYVNGPKKNPAWGSIKTPELGFVSIPIAQLGNFQQGARYCIEVEETAKGFKNFIRFANEAPQQQHQPQGNGYQQPRRSAPAPIARSLPPRPQPPSQPQLPQQPQSDEQARQIFITGAVGRAMGSGTFTAKDILQLTKEASAAWDIVLRGMQEPPFDDALPDPNSYGAGQRPFDDGNGTDEIGF